MKLKHRCIAALLTGLLFFTGCSSDEKDLERLLYVSAVGIDYKDEQYHAYLQAINFQSTAKTESDKEGGTKVAVSEGTGNTIEDALFELYQTSQEKIFWGHITAIVIGEGAFKHGINDFVDSITRYYEFRLTPWVFSTTESIRDIFSTIGFFDQSPLSTILHEPEGIYDQNSSIKPIKLQKLISQIYEPGYTSCIPLLSINPDQWLEKKKPSPKLMISGAVFLKNVQYKSTIPLKQLSGLRWIQSGSKRIGIPVPNDVAPSVQLVIKAPKAKFKLNQTSGQLKYNVHVKATGYIVSRFDNQLIGLQQLTKKANEVIEREIRELHKLGIENKTDILNLEYQLYRYHYSNWESASPVEEQFLQENALNEVNVRINLIHSSSEVNARTHPNEKKKGD